MYIEGGIVLTVGDDDPRRSIIRRFKNPVQRSPITGGISIDIVRHSHSITLEKYGEEKEGERREIRRRTSSRGSTSNLIH